MTDAEPSLEEWSTLYQAAIHLRAIAPWQWMEETDVFGVQNPVDGELGFVSVMGALGNYLGVAVYLGAEGLDGFWGIQGVDSPDPGGDLLRIGHLTASFQDRQQTSPTDRAVIRSLGLAFRGRQAWPLFRSIWPGYFPYYLQAAEARFLSVALEQAAEVSLQFKENPALLRASDEFTYLVRVPRQEAEGWVWESQPKRVEPPEPRMIAIQMDEVTLRHVAQLPRQRVWLECDLFVAPVRIGPRGTRPECAYLLLTVEGSIGYVLGSEFLSPHPSLEVMYEAVPLHVARQLARVGFVPAGFKVRSSVLSGLLRQLGDELGFRVKRASRLPRLDDAREFLMTRFL